MIDLRCCDCMDLMAEYKDNHFDLAVVDPPFGLNYGEFNRTEKASDGTRYKANKYKQGKWDSEIPKESYFKELQRVSKNQIIWGGNYFPVLWVQGCRGIIFWYKGNPVPNFSDGELAWTSFQRPAKQFNFRYYGNLEGHTSASTRIHPTQKPVKLYAWLLQNYAEKGQRVFDSHLGSGSSAIAAHYFGCDFVGCEIDEDYFEAAKDRIDKLTRQTALPFD